MKVLKVCSDKELFDLGYFLDRPSHHLPIMGENGLWGAPREILSPLERALRSTNNQLNENLTKKELLDIFVDISMPLYCKVYKLPLYQEVFLDGKVVGYEVVIFTGYFDLKMSDHDYAYIFSLANSLEGKKSTKGISQILGLSSDFYQSTILYPIDESIAVGFDNETTDYDFISSCCSIVKNKPPIKSYKPTIDQLYVETDILERWLLVNVKKKLKKSKPDGRGELYGDLDLQEETIKDYLQAKYQSTFPIIPKGEKVKTAAFFLLTHELSESVFNKAWQRLLKSKSIESEHKTR